MTRHRLWAGLLALSLAGSATAPLVAQTARQRAPQGWSRVRIAKWSLLGAAAGFGAFTVIHGNRANRAYDALFRKCEADASQCRLTNGRYGAQALESDYQTALQEDRRAQIGILGLQLSVLGTAGLFIYDLRNGRPPPNIPYPVGRPTGGTSTHTLVVGGSLRF